MRPKASNTLTAGEDFAVDRSSHLLGSIAEHFGAALKALGRLETRLLEDQLGPVDKPVYVTGLARSGSTMLLEMLHWQPGVVTHRYRDFPMLHVPVLWNRFLKYAGGKEDAPKERAHRDGIMITRESPEAFEEVLWMSFFPDLHDETRSSVLDSSTRHPEFERFYRDHIRKLLMLRGGQRYVSKGNYNVTRMQYLLRMFPDARFVVPVRNPYWHVASLMKQHKLFIAGQTRHPRARAHLARAGHFEFGLDRRAIHTGDERAVQRVLECWREGREVEGWARYWSLIYDFVVRVLTVDEALAEATLIVSYERLCSDPASAAERLFGHCGFAPAPELLERAQRQVRFPDYYTPDLSDGERDTIARVTRDTTARLREHVDGDETSPWAPPPDAAAGMQIA